MKPKIVVVGSSNTDMSIKLKEFPAAGETVLGNQFITSQGGKGANQAVAAARLGAEVIFIARLGNDSFGDAAFAAYLDEGIDVRYIVRDEKVHTGVALIMVNEKAENMIAVAMNANASLSAENIFAAEEAFRGADCVLLQLEIPIEAVQAAITLGERHGCRILLNPAPISWLPLGVLSKVDSLTPNETEAEQLARLYNISVSDGNYLKLKETIGVKNLVVTLGSKGALIVGEKPLAVPSFPVKAEDTTAAGDAFNAGLAYALAQGEDLEQAVCFANAVAAKSTTRAGAQTSLPYKGEVDLLIQKGM